MVFRTSKAVRRPSAINRMDPETYRHHLVQGLLDLAAQRERLNGMIVHGDDVSVSLPGSVPQYGVPKPIGTPVQSNLSVGLPPLPTQVPGFANSQFAAGPAVSLGELHAKDISDADLFPSRAIPQDAVLSQVGGSRQPKPHWQPNTEHSPSAVFGIPQQAPEEGFQTLDHGVASQIGQRPLESPLGTSTQAFAQQVETKTEDKKLEADDNQPKSDVSKLELFVFFEDDFDDHSIGEEKPVELHLPSEPITVGNNSYRVDQTTFKDSDHALFASMYQAVEIAKANRPRGNKDLIPEAAMSIQATGEGDNRTFTQSRFRLGPCKKMASGWACSSTGMGAGKDSVAVFHLQPPDQRESSEILNYDELNERNREPSEEDWIAYDELKDHVGPELKFYIVDPVGGVQEFYKDENDEKVVTEKWPKGTFSWKGGRR